MAEDQKDFRFGEETYTFMISSDHTDAVVMCNVRVVLHFHLKENKWNAQEKLSDLSLALCKVSEMIYEELARHYSSPAERRLE